METFDFRSLQTSDLGFLVNFSLVAAFICNIGLGALVLSLVWRFFFSVGGFFADPGFLLICPASGTLVFTAGSAVLRFSNVLICLNFLVGLSSSY